MRGAFRRREARQPLSQTHQKRDNARLAAKDAYAFDVSPRSFDCQLRLHPPLP
jgi:hypothetical protein